MPSTIATLSSGIPALQRLPQRKIFRCGSYYFAFFSDGTNMVYYTSPDGINWTSHTAVVACSDGLLFSVRYYNIGGVDYVYYARRDVDASYWYVYFCRGTISGDTITWGTEYNVFQTGPPSSFAIGAPDVEITTDGYAWAGFGLRFVGVWARYYVRSNSNNDGSGSWSTSTLFSLVTGTNSVDPIGCLVRLTNARLYAIAYDNEAPIGVKGKLFDTTWGAVESIYPSPIHTLYYFSAGPSGDNVYFVFCDSSSTHVYFMLRTYGVGWGSTETVESTAIKIFSAYEICVDDSTGDCYVFTIQAPLGTTIYYYKRTAGSWGVQTTLYSSENNPISGTLNSYINTDSVNNEIGLAWDNNPPGRSVFVRFGVFNTLLPSAAPKIVGDGISWMVF